MGRIPLGRPLWAPLTALLLGAAAAAAAQAPASPQLPPLTGLAVTGSSRCTADSLVAATGLHLQQAISLDLLNQAVRRLSGSGNFSRVTYHYDYSAAKGTRVQFEVTDQPQMLPVAFDNFIWLPQDQVINLLRRQVPLFCGVAPVGGSVDQQIAAALQAWLRQHGWSAATVQGFPTQAAVGGAFISFTYFVSGVSMPVQQVAFPGAPPDLAGALQAKAKTLLGGDYSRDRMQGGVAGDFLPLLRNQGYLQAAFAAPAVAIVDAAHNGVEVSFAITPGALYRWGQLGFEGNAVLATPQLAAKAKLHSGAVASQALLDQDVAAVQKLYKDSGYLQAAVTSRYDFSQPGVASPAIVITEGTLFHMGTVSFEGVAARSAAQLAALWTLAPGQPFRESYLGQYVDAIALRFNLRDKTIKTTEKLDAQRQLVDVVIALTPAGGGSR